MKQLDDIVGEVSISAKNMGYRKNRLSWYKTKDNLTVVFSIQKSQFGSDAWFYLFGICLHEIAEGNKQSINSCQIRFRIDNAMNKVLLPSESITKLLERWDTMYGDLYLLRVCAVQGKLPGQYTEKAVRYLTSVNLSSM